MYEHECQCEYPEPQTNGKCANCGKPIPEMEDSLEGWDENEYDRDSYNK